MRAFSPAGRQARDELYNPRTCNGLTRKRKGVEEGEKEESGAGCLIWMCMINGRDAHSPLPLLPHPPTLGRWGRPRRSFVPKRRPEEKRKSAQAPINIYFRALRFVLWAVKGRFLFCGRCLGTAEVRKSRKPPPRNSLWFGTAPFLSPFPFSLTTIDERLSLGQKRGGRMGGRVCGKGGGEKRNKEQMILNGGGPKGERGKEEKLLLFRLCRKRRNFFLPLLFSDCI